MNQNVYEIIKKIKGFYNLMNTGFVKGYMQKIQTIDYRLFC
ncbi:TPA: hypothetical protein ACGO63_000067 [Streptococcus suis]